MKMTMMACDRSEAAEVYDNFGQEPWHALGRRCVFEQTALEVSVPL